MGVKRYLYASMLVLALAAGAHAQFIGYVSPQTEQQTLATNVACTGSAQTFAIKNLGQTQHYLSLRGNNNVQRLSAELDGIDKQGNVYRISDILNAAGVVTANTGSVTGAGYFPQIQAVVTCLPSSTGTFTLSYSGAWATFNGNAGSYLAAQLDHIVFAGASGSQAVAFQTPFGTTGGQIYFQYSTASAVGNFLSGSCQSNNNANTQVFSFTLANVTGLQVFQIPEQSCLFLTITYQENNPPSSAVSSEYLFNLPGKTLTPAGYAYSHITGTTATAVKATSGYLHTLSINTGAAGTVSIFDLATAACTGTPSTNTVAVVTATTSTAESFFYDLQAQNGICVKASAAMDLTASYQ